MLLYTGLDDVSYLNFTDGAVECYLTLNQPQTPTRGVPVLDVDPIPELEG